MLCPCLVDGTPIPECVGCSVPIVFGYCRLCLLQILYRPYKAYEGGTQTTTGHISQQLANNHQQTCLELYGQTMIANWLIDAFCCPLQLFCFLSALVHVLRAGAWVNLLIRPNKLGMLQNQGAQGIRRRALMIANLLHGRASPQCSVAA